MKSNVASVLWVLAGAFGGLAAGAIYFGLALWLIDTGLFGKTVVDASALGARAGMLAMAAGIPIGSLGTVALLEKRYSFGQMALGVLVALALSGLAIVAFFNGHGLDVFAKQLKPVLLAVVGFGFIMTWIGKTMRSSIA